MSDKLTSEEIEFMVSGRKVEAIRSYRARTDCNIPDAKKIVETAYMNSSARLEAEIKKCRVELKQWERKCDVLLIALAATLPPAAYNRIM
jgi:ribosomal protein L7/L12